MRSSGICKQLFQGQGSTEHTQHYSLLSTILFIVVLIHTIFAVIKACLAAAVAALLAGASIVGTIVVLVVIGGMALAGVFGVGGSRFAARRRARREGASE